MNKKSVKQKLLENIKQLILFNFIFIGSLFGFFFFYNFLGINLNDWGIHPRTFRAEMLPSFLTSYFLHGDYVHLLSNLVVLIPLLNLLFVIEKNPFFITLSLSFIAGFFTWLLGAPNSVHIGASGLIFALFGYFLFSFIFQRKIVYLLTTFIVVIYYSTSIVYGLIPQEKVSFAAHFGGFLGGIIIPYLKAKYQNKNDAKNDK